MKSYRSGAIPVQDVSDVALSPAGDYIATVAWKILAVRQTGLVLSSSETCVWRSIEGIKLACVLDVVGRPTSVLVACEKVLQLLTVALDPVAVFAVEGVVAMEAQRSRNGWVILLTKDGKLWRLDVVTRRLEDMGVPKKVRAFCQNSQGGVVAVAEDGSAFVRECGSKDGVELGVKGRVAGIAAIPGGNVIVASLDDKGVASATLVNLDTKNSVVKEIPKFPGGIEECFVGFDEKQRRAVFACDASDLVVCASVCEDKLGFVEDSWEEHQVSGYVKTLRCMSGTVAVACEDELTVLVSASEKRDAGVQKYEPETVFKFRLEEDPVVQPPIDKRDQAKTASGVLADLQKEIESLSIGSRGEKLAESVRKVKEQTRKIAQARDIVRSFDNEQRQCRAALAEFKMQVTPTDAEEVKKLHMELETQWQNVKKMNMEAAKREGKKRMPRRSHLFTFQVRYGGEAF